MTIFFKKSNKSTYFYSIIMWRVCLFVWANPIESSVKCRQRSAHFFINCKKSLFSDLISVNAENPKSQNHEDANGRIILITFELIAEYDLLTETQNSYTLFSPNIYWSNLAFYINELLFFFGCHIRGFVVSKWIDQPSIFIICDGWEVMLQFWLSVSRISGVISWYFE